MITNTLGQRHLALWSVVLASLVAAQVPDGRITGLINDSASARVPNARVYVLNLATGVKTSTTSNNQGNYRLQGLISGIYRLEAEAAGFKRYMRHPIEVRVGDILTIDIGMELGAVSESVTVTSEAPLLDVASTSLGKVMDNRRITDLPVPGGNVFYMANMTPGIATAALPTSLLNANELGTNMQVSGTPTGSSLFSIDGNPIMTQSGGITISPPQDMVQEFRVQTAAYDASIGRFTGAYINLVMKSGTNQLHGSASYSNLSRGMMSHTFFTNLYIYDPKTGPITSDKIDQAWPPQRIVQYRGVVGGPLFLPKVYDGRNRTFWMFGVHALDRTGSTRAYYTVPTERERVGDFSELLALGSRYQIYDPATIAPAANGRFSRQPLAGNIIPASRIHPMSSNRMQYYPLPNTAGTVDGINNYTDPDASGNDYNDYIGRIDHSISDRNRLFGSFTVLEQRDHSLQSFHNIAKGNRLHRQQRGVALNDTWTVTPTLLFELKYGLTRYGQYNYPPSLGYDLTQLGLPSSLVNQFDSSLTTLPETSITGYTTTGAGSGTNIITNYHTFSGVGTNIRGNHTLRFGGEFRVLQENRYAWGYVSPYYTFTTAWTQGPLDNSSAAPMGQGLAAFLLGTLTSGGTDRNASAAEQSKYLGFFLQDEWKATSRLTLTLGLRYEQDLPPTERFNRSIRNFDYAKTVPFESAAQTAYAKSPITQVPASTFRTLGSLLYAGVDGSPRALWNRDSNNFSPRFGLAWRWRPQTVIRGGYGIFYVPLGSDSSTVSQLGYSQRTTITPSVDSGQTFRATLLNPFPDGILDPAGAAMGYRSGLGTALTYFAPNLRAGYNQRWSLGVQHEFPHRLLLEANYVGNRSVGLAATKEYNPVPRQYYSTLSVRDQATIDFLTAAVANPFYKLSGWEGAGLQTVNTTRAQLLRPYPHFTSITASENTGYSWYHSLQARAEKRFSHGYTFELSYTYSKLMEAISRLNDTDPMPYEIISAVDAPHVLAANGVYELPFGRGKRWISSGYWPNMFFGGWQVHAMYQVQSGPPIEFGNIFFNGDIKNIALPSSERSIERWFNTNAGFERASNKQPAQNIRTFPFRFNGIRSNGYNNLNASVNKSFKLREKLELQFRAEAIDLPNTLVFAAPSATPSSTTFGQVSSQRGTQRRITFFGKLNW